MASPLQPAPGNEPAQGARVLSQRADRSAPPPQEIEGADADLFDYAKLRDYLGFVIRSTGRRWLTVLAVFSLTVAAAVGSLAVLPKTYHCEIKIQAQRNMVISTLTGISRAWDFELPSRAAGDLILRHDNLVSLVRRTDLVQAFAASRAPILQLKDWAMLKLSGPQSADMKEEVMVGTLEKKLWVETSEDTVTIGVDWPDAKTAYRIIQAAHQNFLEARQYKEVSAISEAIGLLQGRAQEARDKVHTLLERVQALRGPGAKAPRKPRPAIRKPVARPAVNPELEQLRAQIRSKQQVIVEMEDFRRRRIADLSARLAELKQTFNEFHPAVIDLQQNLAQQEREENPQVSLLRQELRKLEDEYDRRGGAALESSDSESASRLAVEVLQVGRAAGDEVESPEIEQAKADLKYAFGRYSSLTEKIDEVKTELEAQRAAFHYRYGVLRPASVPPSPSKPNKKMVLAAAAVLGLLLGVVAALLRDLRSRKILEAWQVDRQLGVAIVGDVQMP